MNKSKTLRIARNIWVFAILLCILLAGKPQKAAAEDTQKDFTGWIPISTADDMQKLFQNQEDSKYYLVKDIDMSRYGYWNSPDFEGTLDGNGHCIKNMTSLKNGLFSELLEGAEVKNLRLVNVNIRVSDDLETSSYDIYLGGIAGRCGFHTKISNCAVSGDVSGDSIGDTTTNYDGGRMRDTYVGGIVGVSSGEIETCINEATVKGRGTEACVGGIVGWGGRISNCCNLGQYSVDNSGFTYSYSSTSERDIEIFAGGISGRLGDIISNCYSNGNGSLMNGSFHPWAKVIYALGGLVGHATENAEIFGGYYFKGNEGKIDSLYKPVRLFDTDRSKKSSYSGWDFDTVWMLNKGINGGYPIPKWYVPYIEINAPYANMQSGTYNENFTVELSTEAENAKMYYTTDGTKPTNLSKQYTGSIPVDHNMALKVMMVVDGSYHSGVSTYKYKVRCAPPKANYQDGKRFKSSAKIKLSTSEKNAAIYYTTDGTKPTEQSKKYHGTITLRKSTVLKAVTIKSGKSKSKVISMHYVVEN